MYFLSKISLEFSILNFEFWIFSLDPVHGPICGPVGDPVRGPVRDPVQVLSMPHENIRPYDSGPNVIFFWDNLFSKLNVDLQPMMETYR